MGNSRVIPTELNGSTAAAVAAQHRQHDRDRIRLAEARCANIVERAWAWIDERPAIAADHDLAIFAAQAITLGRTPAGLTTRQLEDWLTDSWRSWQEVPA